MQIVDNILAVMGVDKPQDEAGLKALMRRAARAEDAVFAKFMPQTQDYLDLVRIAIRAKKGLPAVPVLEEVQVEPEHDDVESTESIPDDLKIEVVPEPVSVGNLLQDFEQGRLKRPLLQRNFVWKVAKQRLFLDCAIMGVPMPNIMLASETAGDNKQILDGFQRITTMSRFREGKVTTGPELYAVTGIGEWKTYIDKKTGNEKKKFIGRTFDQLPGEMQHRFLNRKLVVQDVRAAREHWPFIFRVLNIGGSPLNAMEIRRATFPCVFLGLLEEVTENHQMWKTLFGENNRYLGLQSLLRAYAMHDSYEVYLKSKGIDKFLDTYCETMPRYSKEELQQQRVRLDFILEMLHDGVGPDSLRLAEGKPVNLGLVDIMFHAANLLLDGAGENSSMLDLGNKLSQVRVKILENPDILYALTHDTSGVTSVSIRMLGVEHIVGEILHTSRKTVAGGVNRR